MFPAGLADPWEPLPLLFDGVVDVEDEILRRDTGLSREYLDFVGHFKALTVDQGLRHQCVFAMKSVEISFSFTL